MTDPAPQPEDPATDQAITDWQTRHRDTPDADC